MSQIERIMRIFWLFASFVPFAQFALRIITSTKHDFVLIVSFVAIAKREIVLLPVGLYETLPLAANAAPAG